MRDKPFGAALLEVAQRALAEEITPGLKGRERYAALMIANAMRIVAREIEAEARAKAAWDRALAHARGEDSADPEASVSRLVAAIRGGDHDADPALHGALLDTAQVAAAVWKPSLAEAPDRV